MKAHVKKFNFVLKVIEVAADLIANKIKRKCYKNLNID